VHTPINECMCVKSLSDRCTAHSAIHERVQLRP
jgi:precorrin-3B methylase